MAKEQLTETEGLAVCIARPMADAAAFDKAVAEKAMGTLALLFQNKRVDTATFARIGARIGNHSAMRQWGEKQGLVPVKAVGEDALAKEVKRLIAMDAADVSKMAE